MTVYDVDGNELTEYDLSKGTLRENTVHHDAIYELGHYEYGEDEKGCLTQFYVIDVPAQPEYEEIVSYTYEPYDEMIQLAIEEQNERDEAVGKLPSFINSTEHNKTMTDAQIEAIVERNEFMEDAFAELAMIVYGGMEEMSDEGNVG